MQATHYLVGWLIFCSGSDRPVRSGPVRLSISFGPVRSGCCDDGLRSGPYFHIAVPIIDVLPVRSGVEHPCKCIAATCGALAIVGLAAGGATIAMKQEGVPTQVPSMDETVGLDEKGEKKA